jgi:hypothetical protein
MSRRRLLSMSQSGKTRMNLEEEQNAMRLRNQEKKTALLTPKLNPRTEQTPAKSLHRLAATSGTALRRTSTDKNGIIIPPSGRLCIDIRVSKAQLERALSVASTLLFALEERGFEVTAGCPGKVKTCTARNGDRSAQRYLNLQLPHSDTCADYSLATFFWEGGAYSVPWCSHPPARLTLLFLRL